MKLAEACAAFLEQTAAISPEFTLRKTAPQALISYFSPDAELREVTPARLRDLLSRWYVEDSFASGSVESETARGFVDWLAQFFAWAYLQGLVKPSSEVGHLLAELRQTLPRALDLARDLAARVRNRRGVFNFPEFLTSFEQGGRSQYDVDAPGDVGAIEGYFRVIRVEGSAAEADELISERRISPINLPCEIAARLDDQYIMNLQLVRTRDGWEINDSGVVYPPGTDVLAGD